MPFVLDWRLHQALLEHIRWFCEKGIVGRSRRGIESRIRLLACLQLLKTGFFFDSLDDSATMGNGTIQHYFSMLIKNAITIYREASLRRRPTDLELGRMELEYCDVGFKGCVGSMDCMKIF